MLLQLQEIFLCLIQISHVHAAHAGIEIAAVITVSVQ